MNALTSNSKANAYAKPLRKKRQENSSYEQRTLEKQISDDHILSLVEDYFRSRTIGLIHSEDQVRKSWLDVDSDGNVSVKFLVYGPPLKPKKRGVKITVFNGT